MKEEFDSLVENYMLCDKRTLAEMLALRDLNGKEPIYEPIPRYPINCPPSPLSVPCWPPDAIPTVWCTTSSNKNEGENRKGHMS